MEFLDHFEGFIASKTRIAKGLWALFKLEAKLAELAIYPLIVSIILLIVVALTTWLLIMMLVGYGIMLAVKGSILWGMGGVLMMNLLAVLCLLKQISTCLKHLSFAKTRACMSNYPLREPDESAKDIIGINSEN